MIYLLHQIRSTKNLFAGSELGPDAIVRILSSRQVISRRIQNDQADTEKDEMDIAPASPERSLMVMVASSSSPSDPAPQASQEPTPSEELTQYRPQRTLRRSLQDMLQPFTQSDVLRERNPRRFLGEVFTEMMAAERRSHAYNDELNEAVEIFRAREAWWRRGLHELQETVGTERAQFEELA